MIEIHTNTATFKIDQDKKMLYRVSQDPNKNDKLVKCLGYVTLREVKTYIEGFTKMSRVEVARIVNKAVE